MKNSIVQTITITCLLLSGCLEGEEENNVWGVYTLSLISATLPTNQPLDGWDEQQGIPYSYPDTYVVCYVYYETEGISPGWQSGIVYDTPTPAWYSDLTDFYFEPGTIIQVELWDYDGGADEPILFGTSHVVEASWLRLGRFEVDGVTFEVQ